jgi:hypothetical protein
MVSFPDLLFLALQIILALGNRPKAERYTYTTSIAVYAFLSAYLIFNTVVLTVKAFCVSLRFLSRSTVTDQADSTAHWIDSSCSWTRRGGGCLPRRCIRTHLRWYWRYLRSVLVLYLSSSCADTEML